MERKLLLILPVLFLIAGVGLVYGFDSTDQSRKAGSPDEEASATPGGDTGCRTPSPAERWKKSYPLVEVRGDAAKGELWALVFQQLPIQVDREVKIVWRMTGTGSLKLVAEHADGTRIRPVYGPREQGGSTWNRPGNEWGSGFVFPKAGCWRVLATRKSIEGDVLFFVKQ